MATVRGSMKIQNVIAPEATTTPLVAAGASAATILSGTPCKLSTSGYVVPMVSGDGTTGTCFVGLAKSDSTETTAADGRVTLWLPIPNLVYSAVASQTTAATTQAKIDALFGKRVTLSLSAFQGTWSVSASAADASTNCIIIVGGDYNTNTLYFVYDNAATLLNY